MPDHKHFLRKQENWKDLFFYRKSEVLYQLTFRFTQRFLQRGDRTIDQMVQAARSGKQNIIEGFTAGVTSTKTEIKLLNVARASIQELQEDFKDYILARQITFWDASHPRFQAMMSFTQTHNDLPDYNASIESMTDEEISNLGFTLCKQVDVMMTNFLKEMEQHFIEEGGMSERMTAARLGRRKEQNETIEAQAHEIEDLKANIDKLQALLDQQQATIAELNAQLASSTAELEQWHSWWQTNKHLFPKDNSKKQE